MTLGYEPLVGEYGARETALLWLNDRLGHVVELRLIADVGECNVCLVAVRGTLRHWREDPRASELSGELRADLEGCYFIGGDARALNLSDLPDTALPSIRSDELRIDFSSGLWLSITDGEG